MPTYYSPTGAPVADTRGSSTSIRNEFQAIAAGFTSASGDITARGLIAGQAWAGTHDFTGATLTATTAAPGSTGNAVATIDYVNAAPFGPAGVSAAMITSALGYTPYNAANPSSYISVVSSAMVLSALGFTPYNGATNPSGFLTAVTSSAITAALGFAPYNGTANPNGYLTSSALAPYLTSSTASTTYLTSTNAAATYLAKSGGTMTAPLLLPGGSAGAPAITFAGDTGTGFYRISAGVIGIAAGGVLVATISASGIKALAVTQVSALP